MGWTVRLRDLPLRTKVMITVVGGALALLGASTWLSFRYWRSETLAAAEQQALLAAGAVRASVEGSLAASRPEQARRSLRRLVESAPIASARVYDPAGAVLLSTTRVEEGRRQPGVWIPSSGDLPATGLVRPEPDRDAVRAFLPLAVPGASVLEVEFSLGPLREALDRGARLGMGLLVGSLFAMAVILFTMLEREVVGPVERVAGLFRQEEQEGPRRREDELGRLQHSVEHLIEKGQAAEERAAAQEREMAAQAGLAQVGEMAAEMAHEFKRPLASLRTALELMEQEYALDERGGQLKGLVDQHLDKLTETMRDLFALARPLEFEHERVDTAELVDGALAQLAGHPAAAGVRLVREYDPAAARLHGDPRRLEQAVLNVLLNAVEATPGGGRVTVRTRALDDRVRIEVEDAGAGIPPEEREKVLRPFYSTKPMGTGLGLPLVARIVAAHGGRLTIESEPGRGSIVGLELPAEPRPATASEEPKSWPTHASSS